jgi:hypothetical protein
MKMLQGQEATERRQEWLSAPVVTFPEGEAFRLPRLMKLTGVMIQKDEKTLSLEFQTEQGQRVRAVLAKLAAEQLVQVALQLRGPQRPVKGRQSNDTVS